jgi:nitroreductase
MASKSQVTRFPPAMGLGACLTTNHMLLEDEVKSVLGLPAPYRTFALLPIGYPVNKFGRSIAGRYPRLSRLIDLERCRFGLRRDPDIMIGR